MACGTPMIRPTVARVDPRRRSDSNFRAIAGVPYVDGPAATPRIIAVVKANAYGHGAAQVALALEEAGAAMLACADIEEGIVLRQAGVRRPILVFGALGVSDLDGVFAHDLTPTISTRPPRARCRPRPRSTASGCNCHLKIDTGMNRLGFRHDNLGRTLPEVAASANLTIDAVYTHFATADDPEHPAFAEQRERFERSARDAAGARHHDAASATRPTAPRCCATSASGTTSSAPACCSTASFRRRSPRRCRCDLPCHSIAVSWR